MNRDAILTGVREVLDGIGASAVREDVALGEGGLALDSISIAEVLLECETRFGASAAPLLDGQPITVGRLVDYWLSAGQ